MHEKDDCNPARMHTMYYMLEKKDFRTERFDLRGFKKTFHFATTAVLFLLDLLFSFERFQI